MRDRARRMHREQVTRFAALDPLLPEAAPDPQGQVLAGTLPDGSKVVGVLTQTDHELGTPPSLWSMLEVWELFPLIGEDTYAGMQAMLASFRRHMSNVGSRENDDSSCVVTWPSLDAPATKALLAHGFQPLAVLAVRPATSNGVAAGSLGPSDVTIRLATLDDLETLLPLVLAELEYSSQVGNCVLRAEALDIKRETLTYHLEDGDPVWLAERDGVALGMAECWLTDAEPVTRRHFPVPAGRWGYVNTVSVLPGARGTGIGRALMTLVHRELHGAGAIGTYLYYNPPNPISSVFWPRLGYRPLWTTWEVRPADALR
jgi:GNAT superfamily N-acetyltransferase